MFDITLKEPVDTRNMLIDPYSFGKAIELAQDLKRWESPHINVLFNKGRYFECTLPSSIIKEVAELSGCTIEFNTMIVDDWRKLEDFVIALNSVGYYAVITIDWV